MHISEQMPFRRIIKINGMTKSEVIPLTTLNKYEKGGNSLDKHWGNESSHQHRQKDGGDQKHHLAYYQSMIFMNGDVNLLICLYNQIF